MKLNIKILVLADGMGPSDARGVEIIGETLDLLNKDGVDITLVTTTDHLRNGEEFDSWKKNREDKGVKIYTVDMSKASSDFSLQTSGILSKFPTFLLAAKLIWNNDYDVIHEYSSSPLLFIRTMLLGLIKRTKTIHTIITYNDTFHSRAPFGFLGNFLTKVIFPSKSFAGKYRLFLNQRKVAVISQGVNIDRFKKADFNKEKFGIPKKSKSILFLGPPEEGKGLFLYLDAIVNILKKRRDLFFLFVFHRKLSAEKYDLGIQRTKNIFEKYPRNFNIIEGIVNVPDVIASVEAVVLPQVTHHGTLVYPQTLLEAMAVGKAVVAPQTPEIAELIENGKTGIIFTPGDVGSLSEAIEKAIEKPELGFEAQKFIVEKHNIKKSTERLKELYSEII